MTEHDPLAGVSVFVTAARVGSFTLAGERLGITKSAVGKSIARLEARLGTKLFHRTTRLTRLTADGEAYLAACAGAIDDIAAAQAALSSTGRILRGRLRIDMPVAFGRHTLLPILTDIVHQHPGIELALTFTDATSDLLQEDVDLAIRFGELKDSSHLVARHLVNQDRVICAAPRYLDRRGRPTTVAAVRDHDCVVGSPKGPPLAWVVREEGQVRRFLPPATHQISDGEAMVEAAAAGLGLCQVPRSMVRSRLADTSLEAVLTDVSTVPVEVHAVWPRRAHLSPRVRHVVDRLIVEAGAGRLD
ncbi:MULTISPECIES: LysR substrate-binding domain-containing protein [unclassified Sphingomonas]|uniref:LysR substrate-binding domain-containing protein n=1 Tax=unclassified Sphingomonas TaxID=196159 RepID=UPI0010522BFC|nr:MULTISPECIES: LysR substrate-binding domain-containing protein [unclassified Sphingomonas]MBB3349506.1 DNA-binding transcriptional LysR family regulator [Sphingomonas sp. BK069]TCP32438.1 LysR family transcriptional regulator [Sphingomonas sp. BK235]